MTARSSWHRAGHALKWFRWRIYERNTSGVQTDRQVTGKVSPPWTVLTWSFGVFDSEVRVGSHENGIGGWWLPVNPSRTVAAELAAR